MWFFCVLNLTFDAALRCMSVVFVTANQELGIKVLVRAIQDTFYQGYHLKLGIQKLYLSKGPRKPSIVAG